MDNSPLGRLPAELRNDIYNLVLLDDKPIILDLKRKAAYKPRPRDSTSGHRTALLLTCKTVHSEARPIFYGANTFKMHLLPENATILLENLSSSTTELRNLTLLRKLHIDIGCLTGASPKRALACLTQLLALCRLQPAALRKCRISVVLWAVSMVHFWPDERHVEDFTYMRLQLRLASLHASIRTCLRRIVDAQVECQRALQVERARPISSAWPDRVCTLGNVIHDLDGLYRVLLHVLIGLTAANERRG